MPHGEQAVLLRPGHAALFADIGRLVGLAFGPLDMRPSEHLALVAVLARHIKSALIGGQPFGLDPREPLGRGGRNHHDALVPKRRCPFQRQAQRVALAARADRVAVHLVGQHHPDWTGGQAARGIGPDNGDMAPRIALMQNRVAAVPGSRVGHLALERGGVPQHRGEAVLAPHLRHVERWLQHQDRGRILRNVN